MTRRLLAPVLEELGVKFENISDWCWVWCPRFDCHYLYYFTIEKRGIYIHQRGSGNPPYLVRYPPSMMQAMIWRQDLISFLKKQATNGTLRRLGIL